MGIPYYTGTKLPFFASIVIGTIQLGSTVVGLYSNIDMISSLCILMARGALISMVVVIFVLPSMFMVIDEIYVNLWNLNIFT